MTKRIYNRPGSRGHRNAENTPTDKNDAGKKTASGRPKAAPKATDKTQKRFESRNRLERTGEKRRQGQDEPRDSTRMPARGASEFSGAMNKRLSRTERPIRTARTATKGQ